MRPAPTGSAVYFQGDAVTIFCTT